MAIARDWGLARWGKCAPPPVAARLRLARRRARRTLRAKVWERVWVNQWIENPRVVQYLGAWAPTTNGKAPFPHVRLWRRRSLSSSPARLRPAIGALATDAAVGCP